MLRFLIPTAKEMTEEKSGTNETISSDKTKKIIEEMSQKTLSELQSIYHFNKEDAALKEQKRWQDIISGSSSSYEALDLYNGLMYRALKTDLTNDGQNYLNQTTFITTALYGIIPASYTIQPHRLDFNTPISINHQSLKQFWKEEYDHFLERFKQDTIISLLSSEFETVFSTKYRQELIKVKFYEKNASGTLKQHSTISKKGRGYFLRASAIKDCQTIEDLKVLSFEGYHYEKTDKQDELIYIRKV